MIRGALVDCWHARRLQVRSSTITPQWLHAIRLQAISTELLLRALTHLSGPTLALASQCCKHWGTAVLLHVHSANPHAAFARRTMLRLALLSAMQARTTHPKTAHCSLGGKLSAQQDLLLSAISSLPASALVLVAQTCKLWSICALLSARELAYLCQPEYADADDVETEVEYDKSRLKYINILEPKGTLDDMCSEQNSLVVPYANLLEQLPTYFMCNLRVLQIEGINDLHDDYHAGQLCRLYSLLPELHALEVFAISGSVSSLDLNHARSCFSKLRRVHTLLGDFGCEGFDSGPADMAWIAQDMPSLRCMGMPFWCVSGSQDLNADGEPQPYQPNSMQNVVALTNLQLETIATLSRVDAGFWKTFTGKSQPHLKCLKIEWATEPSPLEAITNIVDCVCQMESIVELDVKVDTEGFRGNGYGHEFITEPTFVQAVVAQFSRLRKSHLTRVNLGPACSGKSHAVDLECEEQIGDMIRSCFN